MFPLLLIKKVVGKHLDFLIPMLLVAALIGGSMWYVKTIKADREAAQAQVRVLEANMEVAKRVVKNQENTIGQLIEIRKLDAASMQLLAENNTALIGKFDKRKTARNELESKNVDVKKYLDEPVPDDLRRLLNNANGKYLSANQGSGPAAPGTAVERPPAPGD